MLKLAIALTCAALLAVSVFTAVLRPILQPLGQRGAWIISLLLGLSACLYGMVGTPRAISERPVLAPRTLSEAILRLQQHLATQPNQSQAWLLLSQAYDSQGDIDHAIMACDQAVRYAVPNTEMLIACALQRLVAKKKDPRIFDLLNRALTIQPNHPRARLLLGLAQRQAGQPALAAQTWQSLRPLVGKKLQQALDHLIGEARQEAALMPLPSPPQAQEPLPRQ